MNRKERIAEQLGMPQGTANHKLRKSIMFKYVVRAGDNFCYKCGSEIESVDDISIEHKLPWEDRDSDLFWDLDNIAFSHLKCNRPHRSSAQRLTIESPDGHSWCGRCRQHLPVDRFRKREDATKGYEYRCNSCRTEAMRELRAKQKS